MESHQQPEGLDQNGSMVEPETNMTTKAQPQFSSEEEMKEWFWEQHKDQFMANLGQQAPVSPPPATQQAIPVVEPSPCAQLEPSSISCTTTLSASDEQELKDARKSLKLLEAISSVQRQFMQQAEVRAEDGYWRVFLML